MIDCSPLDHRDRNAAVSAPAAGLPSSVDLKPSVTEVENQGLFSSCTANAGCSALELMYNKFGNQKLDFSRMFLYYYERYVESVSSDSGAFPRNIGKCLKQYGVCLEETWPYTKENLTAAPSAEAINEAIQYQIDTYGRLDHTENENLSNIKMALANGVPVLLQFQVTKSFQNITAGTAWTQHSWDINEETLGGHEVLVIGYDDAYGRLLCENSWGSNWADGGFFGIPYSYVDNFKVVQELWVVIPKGLNVPNVTIPETVITKGRRFVLFLATAIGAIAGRIAGFSIEQWLLIAAFIAAVGIAKQYGAF